MWAPGGRSQHGAGPDEEDFGKSLEITRRLRVKDTAQPQAFYGMVDFPRGGADKTGLSGKTAKEDIPLKVRVMPRDAKVVAQLNALGTQFENGTHSW